MSAEWKQDPSPLHLLECGESAVVGKWKLHIDKMKEVKESPLIKSLFGSLSEKEKEVLNMRFGVDDQYAEHERKRKERAKANPYMWRVELGEETRGAGQSFSSMGGSAKTADEAKAIAEAAVEYADLVDKALNGEPKSE